MEDLMSDQLSFWNRYQRFATFFIALGVLGLLSPFSATAQVNWLVTVTFTTNATTGDHQTYSVTRTPATGGNCPYGVPDDGGYHLRICQRDTLSWSVVTPSNQNEVRIFHQHAVLDDSSGQKTHLFQAKNSAATSGGQVDGSVTPNDYEEYEYCIAVYDITNQHLYLHDPKIIIGTGGKLAPSDLVKILERDAEQLNESLRNDSNADVKEDLEKLRKIIHNLKERLHVQ
jgi:hypothetical protein